MPFLTVLFYILFTVGAALIALAVACALAGWILDLIDRGGKKK